MLSTMESQTRVFSTFIERLEDVLCKLQHINVNKLWAYTYIPNDVFRIHSNMKNIINSLVKKTINGKCQWEDLACTDIGRVDLVEKPMFENHITSEEYIAESMKIQNVKPEINDLLNSLLSLQELLGDTLNSSCQISNYSMKILSGIFVHDLVRVNQQYESIWNFLNSVIKIRAESLPQTEGDTRLLDVNLKLLRSIQLSFKEITKIKLEIEHYFKVNIIELQFTDSDNGSYVLSNNYVPKADCSYFPDIKTYEQNANTYYETTQQENIYSEITVSNSVNPAICKLPSMSFSESCDSQENNSGSNLFSPVKHWCDFKGLHSDYFNQPYIYPRDIVFFDPSVFIQSHMGNGTSGKEDYKQSKTVGVDLTKQKFNSKDDIGYSNSEVIRELSQRKRVQIGQKPDQNEQHYCNDNLFVDDIIAKIADEESTNIEGNESLSYDIIQDSINNKDLFDATPLVIEKSDHSYTKTRHNNDQFNVRQNDLEREEPQLYDNLRLMNRARAQKLPESQFFNRLGTLHQYKTATAEDENIIFDPDSLIEIFRGNKVNNNSNSGSIEDGSSSFCLWPVAANYKYVSTSKRGTCLKAVSSSLSENSFGNSLEPIYLNTNYQEEENYENSAGADIFTEHTNTSSCSFFNDSLALLEGEKQDVVNRKIRNPIFNGTFNAFSSIKNTNVKYLNGGLKQLKNNVVQKTMAVQFADCGDSFVVKNKHFTKENIKILNGSTYTNNLNSFISIFTSNLGTDRQVNHHKMFRRTINSLGKRPITRDNLFNNVQTLTSNSGPYRLFDLNGYPLTDSAGNVLKDPYGKSLVDFDLTGFPKGEAKIFDAAGNSPKDVSFDPTQKPKTNTIVLKLTDNLKIPLHLFDKYGRPLTDSYGKLLVNIHGRPLLRFDNFGQPNTDYRGGPLYTENGLRWSPSNTQSKEELTNGVKNIEQLPNSSGNGFSDSFENVSPRQDSSNSKKEACTEEDLNGNDVVNLNTLSSDIWSQLEIVLKNLPKKKKLEPTSSKTSVIVNNVSVPHNPFDKDLMKSIIYLDSLEEESNNIEYTKAKLRNEMYDQCIGDFKTHNNINNINSTMLEIKRNNMIQNLILEKPNKRAFLLKRDELLSVPSKCLIHDTLIHQRDSSNNKSILLNYNSGDAYLSKELPFKKGELFNYNSGDACLSKDLPFKKGELFNYNSGDACISKDLPFKKGDGRNAQLHLNSKKIQQHRNQHCLYNLRDEKFSDYNEFRNNINFPLYTPIRMNRESNSTDFSQSQLTRTDLSKHATDMFTTSDSPLMMIDSSAHSSNPVQKLQDYDNYLRDKHRLNFQQAKQIKKHNDNNFINNYECYQKHCIANLDQNKIDGLQLPYKKIQLSSDVLGKNDRLYELKIAEMVLQSLENNAMKRKEENNTLSFKKDTARKPSSLKVNSNIEQKPYASTTKTNLNELSNDNNLAKNQMPEKIQTYHSLFRFNPKNEAGNVKDDIEVKYIREGSGETTSNVSVKASEINSDESQDEYRGLHVNQIPTVTQFQSKNSTKHGNDHDGLLKSPNHHAKRKFDQFQNQHFGKKYGHNITEKVTPTNKECNLVAFLGSPVKYVLNKLDLTRSSRQKPNRMYRLPKKTNKPHSLDAYNQGDNCQYKNRNNDIVKDNKEMSNKIRQKVCIDRGKLLAFKSKSCIEMCHNENTLRNMSYSGNEDNLQQNTNSSPTNDHTVQTELRRYSSAISYLFEKCEDDKSHQDKNKTCIMNIPKHKPCAFKIIYSKDKNKNRDANHKVIKLQKAVPVQTKVGNHSRRHKKTML